MCLTMLCACSAVPVHPDLSLLNPCPITPIPEGRITNRVLSKLAVDREADTMRCNVDKEALRAWYKAHGDIK